jgi:Cu/Ag efflux pump CusA
MYLQERFNPETHLIKFAKFLALTVIPALQKLLESCQKLPEYKNILKNHVNKNQHPYLHFQVF